MKKTARQIPIQWYAIMDFVTAMIAWVLFFYFRKYILKEPTDFVEYGPKLWWSVLYVPASWLVLYSILGAYHSLLQEIMFIRIYQYVYCERYRHSCIVLFNN